MNVVLDAMAVIHLAKITVLEKTCDYFTKVHIPKMVYDEVLKGKEKGFPDVPIMLELIKKQKITITNVKDKNQLKRINEFNIQGGEAESIAVYLQEKANIIITDDDNVRKKRAIMNLNTTSTPAILLTLLKNKKITMQKFRNSIAELRKIGWFSAGILDKLIMEAEQWEKQ
ncbi:MAG: hypothetical protein ABIA93_04880 [Candidatus Woesearchaeota archaeon]